MLKILTLAILALSASLAFGEDKPAVKSPADTIYEKAISDSSKDCEKQYDLYMKSLDVANGKVAKALEDAKSVLNDTKKGKLSLVERADAINALDEKLKELKKGALSDTVAASWNSKISSEGDFKKAGEVDLKNVIVGKWKRSDGNIFVFNLNGTGLMTGGQSDSLRWIIVKKTVKVTFDTHPGWWQEMTMVDNMTFSTLRDDGGAQAMTKEPK